MEPLIVCSASETSWDESRRLIFLGEGCKHYERRAAWSKVDSITLISPFEEAANYPRLFEQVEDHHAGMLARLASALNEIHNVDRGQRYWEILLGPWLKALIVVVMDRFELLKQALQEYPGSSAIGISPEDRVVAADTYDFSLKIFSDDFNLQVCTEIWEGMGYRFPLRRVRKHFTDHAPIGYSPSPGMTRRMALWLARRSFEADFPTHDVILKDSYFSGRDLARMAVQSGGRIWPVSVPFKARAPGRSADPAFRRKLARLVLKERTTANASSNVGEIASRLIAAHLPLAFLEDYGQLVGESRQAYRRIPRAIFTANAFHFDEVFKHWAGRATEMGTRLLIAQHGGNHALLDKEPLAEHEISIADHYYTWGGMSERPNVISGIPPPFLTHAMPKMCPNSDTGRILFGVMTLSRYFHIMMPIQTPGRFSAYLARQAQFVEALPPAALERLTVRIVNDSTGWDLRARWRENFAGIAQEDGAVPFQESLDSSALYICDHLMTTYLEALTYNVPTLLFWDTGDYVLHDSAVEALGWLRDAGILHDSAESAAVAVASFWPRIREWWSDSHRQRARERFCNVYAPAAGKGTELWFEEFNAFFAS